MSKEKDDNNSIDFSLDDLNPNEFLNLKKGDQLKNIKKLKTLLNEIDNSTSNIENEVYSILFYFELILEKDPSFTNFTGDDSDAMDIVNDLSEKVSSITKILEKIQEIKNNL